MLIAFDDVQDMITQQAQYSGVPALRYIFAPRVGTGPERVAAFFSSVIPALTTPLTSTETASGIWQPPAQNRIAFRGTLDQAQAFFQREQTYQLSTAAVPMTQWTDGLPIIAPTEDKVAAMLLGTSHPATEVVKAVGSAAPTAFQPMGWTATVEKVAVNAVMAGCEAKHLPVILAISTSGCSTGTTVFWNQWQVVSGPIAKEIGMNYSIGEMEGQNKANACIGRAFQLMAINLGGAQVGTNRMNSHGSPVNLGGACFAENIWDLPPGWVGLNEEMGYTKDQSVVMVANTSHGIVGNEYSPSSYRGLQGAGTGGMAARLGVTGIPGPHNWLLYYVDGLYKDRWNQVTFIMVPEMAKDLQALGFTSKRAVYDWLWQNMRLPISEFKKYGWYDFQTNGGTTIEPTSGKPYGSLPDSYMTPALVGMTNPTSFDNIILVSGGDEEVCLHLMGSSSPRNSVYPIDPWR